MEVRHQTRLDDRQKMTDLLSTEKMLASVYNTFCSEAASAPVRNCLCNLLTDEHRIGEELFSEMSNRSWYTVEKAEEAKVNGTRQKFAQDASV
jgi:spore coat protein CotF